MSSSCTPGAESAPHDAAPGANAAGPVPSDAEPWYGSADAHHRPADPARHAWRVYFEGTQMLSDALERRLKEKWSLTLADYNLLLLLAEAPDQRRRLGELASLMVFSPSRVTYQSKGLESRGLIERRAAECGDRRGVEAVLTDAGRDLFRRVAVDHRRDVDELFLSGLAPGEAETLVRVFSRLGRGLQARR